jgi:hypothetical protein
MMEENTNNQIGQLMEPDPIAFSFGAPGWYILLAILLLSLLIYLLVWYIRYRKNAYRREAVQNLFSLKESNIDIHDFKYQLIKILKRVAITSFGRDEVAHLKGLDWLNFIKKHHPKADFSKLMTSVLVSGIYNKESLEKNHQDQLTEEAIQLIKKKYV